MGFLNRKPIPEVVLEPEVEPEPFRPTPGDRYHGAACFSEGFYYPILNDEHGHEVGPNREQRLVWVPETVDGSNLVHAAPEDPNHFHSYGLNPVEITVSEEQ